MGLPLLMLTAAALEAILAEPEVAFASNLGTKKEEAWPVYAPAVVETVVAVVLRGDLLVVQWGVPRVLWVRMVELEVLRAAFPS